MALPKTVEEMRRAMRECYAGNDFARAFTWGEAVLNAHDRPGEAEGTGTLAHAGDAYNLGVVCQQIGDYEYAANLYGEAIRIYQNERTPCRELIYPLTNLAMIKSRGGQVQEALNLYSQVINVAGSIQEQPEDYAAALYNLGNAFADAGNTSEALRFLLMAEKSVKPDDSAESLMRYVHIFNSIGYLKENTDLSSAIIYFERALAILRRIERADSSLTDDLIRNIYYLAEACSRSESYKKALLYYNDALRLIKRKTHGKTQYYPTCLNSMANVLAKLGEMKQSMSLRLEAVEQIKNVVGVKNMSYAGNMRSMSEQYRELGNLEKAAELITEAIEVKKLLLGKHSSDVIGDNLALLEIYIEQNDSDKAIRLFMEILELIDGDFAEFEDVINRLAKMYVKKIGGINELNGFYSKALEIYGGAAKHEMGEADE